MNADASAEGHGPGPEVTVAAEVLEARREPGPRAPILEVLRTDAGALVDADAPLHRVRLDLETRSVRASVEEWRLMGARDA